MKKIKSKKWNFICISESKQLYNFYKEPLGMSGKRALFFSKSIGRRRVYRRSFDENLNNWKYFTLRTEAKAQELCDDINKAYNEDFKVGELKCLQKCESCEKEFDIEIMSIDDDSNWFCSECWKELKPEMEKEYKELIDKEEIDNN